MSSYDRLQNECSIEVLKGKILKEITISDENIFLKVDDTESYQMYHEQDCCENVYVESVVGDIKDLIGEEILEAEEVSNEDEPYSGSDSYTWTFYKIGTRKGSVTIRWLGESNGYYSESVSFMRV